MTRTSPQTLFTLMKGSSFRPVEAREVYKNLPEGAELLLERDRENEYDANAVRVLTVNRVFIAYVAKEDAVQIAAILDAKEEPDSKIELRARVVKVPQIEIIWDLDGGELQFDDETEDDLEDDREEYLYEDGEDFGSDYPDGGRD